jgi:fatty-acyl-CoA synthase
MNEKTLVRKGLGFLNMRSVFKFTALRKKNRDRPFFIFEGRAYTYEETYDQALRYARLFAGYRKRMVEGGRLEPGDQLPVGVYMDNCPEFVFAFFGAAISGSVIIAINTGFRGETITRVAKRAEIALLITDTNSLDEVERTLPDMEIDKDDVYVVGEETGSFQGMEAGLSAADPGIEFPSKIDNFSLLIVIYTSGTTGEPKGVPCTHIKLLGAAGLTWSRLRLGDDDRGYICMPMFHSNAWFIGILPVMIGGSSFVLKRRFSASAFENDILEHGVTYMNYVGQPIHYILVALEKKYGSPEAVEAALAGHPKNRFRIAHGNGAPPVDRKKLIRYLNMDHVYELYGSTEASINTVLMPGDPIESLGRLKSKKVVILDENDRECPPGEVDEAGKLINYDAAVGEICKITKQENVIFEGYFKNTEATSSKFRDGYFRSGDLGHVRVINGKRYLYFDGRTDDWIRKDGENFSAENVVQHVLNLDDVALATAYGVPCEVSDEKVMAALQLRKGASFDPDKTFDCFMQMQEEGGMDPKWMPDYIRIVESFELTHQTQKILTRPLKRSHFNLEKFPDLEVYYRQRGDKTFKKLTPEAWAEIGKAFKETGRENLLYAGL